MNRVAVVTGAAQGIGRAIVEKLLSNGLSVVAIDINMQKLESSFEGGDYDSLMRMCIDVSSYEAVSKAFAEISTTLNRISILVNNAGIQTHYEIAEMSEQIWDETMNINLKSVFLCTKFAIQDMKLLKWGRIINISSMSAVRGSYKHAHYCASKAGIVGLTKAAALELGKHNITCNAVCPGIIETRMILETMENKREKWMQEMPLNRFGHPEDIAEMVAFLASDRADWITGQSFHVNGGIITP